MLNKLNTSEVSAGAARARPRVGNARIKRQEGFADRRGQVPKAKR